MEIEQFKEKIRGLKKSNKQTGFLTGLKLSKYPDGIKWIIRKKEECFNCKRGDIKKLEIIFHKPIEHLTIFEVEMLYFIYVLSKLPLDYAQYHKCIAGKKFIENIKEVSLNL